MIETETLAGAWRRKWGDEWLDTYWSSTGMPHRRELMEAISNLGEIRNALEVGCNAGPNLRLLHALHPRAYLHGIDVNLEALRYGERKAAEEDWEFQPWHGGAVEMLRGLSDGRWDLVFSCYCLAYLSPDDAATALDLMLGLALKAVVIAEPAGDGGLVTTMSVPEYRHDWRRLLEERRLKYAGRITERAVAPPADGLNRVFTMEVFAPNV